ncbi:hypothetical protein MKK50_15325 [Methylobacterium sp. J-043]|nr:hypothetical protein [Methylobacterium sp. J-043]
MNGELWTDAAIEALIRGLDGDDWRERAADINRDLLRWVEEGRITDERAERLNDAIQARHQRTTKAATEKVELRKRDGHTIGGAVGRIVMPMVDRMRPAPVAPPRVVVSNPEVAQPAPVEMTPDRPRRLARRSKRSPAERFRDRRVAKARERRRQAKLAKIPADLFQDYSVAESAALSIIVLDIAQGAAGQCRRTYKHIAASAAVCVRSVAEAVAAASYLGLIAVEHRRGKSSIITPLDPELVGWLRLLEANRHPLSSDEILENRREKRSPPSHAKACMTPSDRDDGSAQEGPSPAPARVGADRRPLPPLGNVARLRVQPVAEAGPSPLDALIARLRPEIEAEEARRLGRET